jgi:hydrogenase maturation factor
MGHDAAVIDFGDRYLVTKSDPITFATDEIGWYAVQVNANDIACLGAMPRWFIATLLLPQGKTDQALVEKIFDQIRASASQIGVALVGGHTEITYNLNRPIVVGTMFGEVYPERLVRSDGAQPGDKLILTKGICVEGTALLAREVPASLQPEASAEEIAAAAAMLHQPGISVVRDAAIVTASADVHAMHDPTEGGVATGIHELLGAANVGAVIEEGALPILPLTRRFCDILDLNPLGLIASGALLAAVAPQDADRALEALKNANLQGACIGTIRAEPAVVLRDAAGNERLLPAFRRDELARLLEG